MKAQYRTCGRTRASRPAGGLRPTRAPPPLGLDLHFHSFASLSPSDTPPGVGLLTFLYSPPLYGLYPWLPTAGPRRCSSICASFLLRSSKLLFLLSASGPTAPLSLPCTPIILRATPLFPGPAPHFQAPPSSLTSPGRPRPGPLLHLAHPLPFISLPRPRLCPVQRLPPAAAPWTNSVLLRHR